MLLTLGDVSGFASAFLELLQAPLSIFSDDPELGSDIAGIVDGSTSTA